MINSKFNEQTSYSKKIFSELDKKWEIPKLLTDCNSKFYKNDESFKDIFSKDKSDYKIIDNCKDIKSDIDFSNFFIGDFLGKGSFNCVYKLVDKNGKDTEYVIRFTKQSCTDFDLYFEKKGLAFQCIGALNCKYICKVLDFGEYDASELSKNLSKFNQKYEQILYNLITNLKERFNSKKRIKVVFLKNILETSYGR